MNKKVEIIIVNFNGFSDTVECLESLENINYDNYGIIVVDNGSTEKPTIQQQNYISANSFYIETGSNLGFSGGNNIGIEKAKELRADYVLLLNNDTIVEPDFLAYMVAAAECHDNVGMIGGRIRYYDQPDTLWYAGGYFDERTGAVGHFKSDRIDDGGNHRTSEVTFVTGCLALIPMPVIERVGVLNESYFLYAEDTDYCARVISDGFKLYYCEDAVIYHKCSATTGKNSYGRTYYMTRNNLEISRKFLKYPLRGYLCYSWRTLKDVLRGRSKIKPVIHGYHDFIKQIKGRYEIEN